MELWEDWIQLVKKGKVSVQQCLDCQHKQFYPRDFCMVCLSNNLDFHITDGSGVIYSFTEVHRSPNPEIFTPPYFVGLVEIEKNIKIICNILITNGNPEIGKKIFFDKISDKGIIYYSD
tara:strand:- start:2632 stop:2988 length:357 start_codon:yes stop_codon:yes gene_type:complete